MSTPIAVFASGRGSNFDAIADAVNRGHLHARIVALVCDKPGAPVLEKARARGIPTLLVPPVEAAAGITLDERRARHDEAVLEALRPYAPRFLVLAGYMRIISPKLLEAFRSEQGYTRIVNVHPSLLPAFPGLDAYAQAFQYGCHVTGASVHLVELEMDSGPICAQEAFSIADCKSVEEVERRGLAVEHRLFPQTLEWILKENFEVQQREGRLCVCPN